jgi:hypothetical protein
LPNIEDWNKMSYIDEKASQIIGYRQFLKKFSIVEFSNQFARIFNKYGDGNE